MPEQPIDADNCLEAWRQVTAILCDRTGSATNLLVYIRQPTIINQSWLVHFNPRRLGGDDIGDVINTIFPRRLLARTQGRQDLFRRYLQLHQRGRRRAGNRGAWGTYFQRLIDFNGDGRVNQLETAIEKLSSWPRRSLTGLTFHLSSPSLDRPRTRGGPCWHFGELLWREHDTVDLVVVYRNHDYFNKALGNFLGLGQLLAFICAESGKTPGQLICHSINAFHDTSKAAMRDLADL